MIVKTSILAALLLGYALPSAGATDRVYYYGDSLAAESFKYFQSTLTKSKNWTVVDRTIPGTSPCDWFDRISRDSIQPGVRAVMIEAFGNNLSRCQLVQGQRAVNGSALYWQRYQASLNNLIQRVPQGIPVWISPAPAARNDLMGGHSHKARMLRTMQEVADFRPNTYVIDAGATAEGARGTYTRIALCLPEETCPDQPKIGQATLRSLDGLHFCPVIKKATVDLLRRCPVYASGAWRFGRAQAQALLQFLAPQPD